MPRSLPPLTSLRAFEAAARSLSFTKAARELHVTPAAISHQIRGLEQFLGVTLFQRTSRRLELTRDGQLAAEHFREAFECIARGVQALRQQGITHLYQTAALFNQHVREQVDVYASLRQLVFGAEAVGTEGVRRMLRAGRPARVLHEYGPTEATVWCTLEKVEEVEEGV